MIEKIDYYLDRITMYRLVIYYLICLIAAATILSFFHSVAYSASAIVFSALFFVSCCYIANKVFSYVFQAPANVESLYISALILALIVSPVLSLHSVMFFAWVSLLAMASKYIISIKKKHIFNPVAFAVALASFTISQSASWWVGTSSMAPFVLLGGLLLIRKLRKGRMVFAFLLTALSVSFFFGLMEKEAIKTLSAILVDSPLFFLGFVMFTEPLTTPASTKLQVLYGAIVGALFFPGIHVGSIYSTPELALLVGNVFSYVVSPKQKLILYLKKRLSTGLDIADFLFERPKNFLFLPGQYMEWTLQHKNTDSRGNRRYFTIASSPTEDTIRLGVKFSPNGSSFKKALKNISSKEKIVGAQLAGEFVLPSDSSRKLAFIAGGIGITPFRSIVKYLIDAHQKRDIVLFYANKFESEICYKDIFDQAEKELSLKTVYTLTDLDHLSTKWLGKKGRIDEAMIQKEAADFKSRLFYLSGSHSMVVSFEKVLRQMSVPSSQIKIDFFPGYV